MRQHEHLPNFSPNSWVWADAASKARKATSVCSWAWPGFGWSKQILQIHYRTGMPHSLQTLNTQTSSTCRSSHSARCQLNPPGSLSTSFAFTELLRTTTTTTSARILFSHSLIQSRSCKITRAQRCRAVRESTKHRDKMVRTVTWCMAKNPNPQSRCENLSSEPPICEFWETVLSLTTLTILFL